MAQLDAVQAARNDLNHGTPLDISHVQGIVTAMVTIFDALQEDTSRLLHVHTNLTAYTGVLTVHAVADSSMRLPFRDSRKYLVGRQPLWEAIASEFQSQPQRCDLVHGSSGTGKTSLAIAVAYELREAFPMQFFMEVSPSLHHHCITASQCHHCTITVRHCTITVPSLYHNGHGGELASHTPT